MQPQVSLEEIQESKNTIFELTSADLGMKTTCTDISAGASGMN